ncbi:hypothetical protein DRQ12_08660 [candidate division KSB1 bacterium]|nr:MAG: hypothetical protein DRQ12_08660 [candidate division KSB1 bacterium]RKY89159.1 MAG: hypothetical protein DRQ11_01720 [candidate division KSB1 bacterium]
MTYWLVILALLVILGVLIFWLFGWKKPDQLVLIEKKGRVTLWQHRLYPKKLCLVLPATMRTVPIEVTAPARGKIDVVIKLAATFFPNPEQAHNLIRVGGWSIDAIDKVSGELKGTLQGMVGEIVELHDVTKITCDSIGSEIKKRLKEVEANLGVKVTSVMVYSAEAADKKIADAIRQQEEARIQEEAEKVSQAARIAQTKAQIEANEQIAEARHALTIKELKLREKQEALLAELEQKKAEQEIERRRLFLDLEREEVNLLTQNPSLLLLTPQVTRLAEASQQLKSAKTVVSVSSDLIESLPQPFQSFLTWISQQQSGNDKKELKKQTKSS